MKNWKRKKDKMWKKKKKKIEPDRVNKCQKGRYTVKAIRAREEFILANCGRGDRYYCGGGGMVDDI